MTSPSPQAHQRRDEERAAAAPSDEPVLSRTQPILDYFGKCEACGYPAFASCIIDYYRDGAVHTRIIATCELPCGWSAQVPLTTMTRPKTRRTEGDRAKEPRARRR